MRFLYKGKDGRPESPVVGYWLIEIKSLFSIVLLKFNKGAREEFHTHAFNALTWFLSGDMEEIRMKKGRQFVTKYIKSIMPKYTLRENLHKVVANSDSWCLSIRGPWNNTWQEWNEKTNKYTTLTHGRRVVK